MGRSFNLSKGALTLMPVLSVFHMTTGTANSISIGGESWHSIPSLQYYCTIGSDLLLCLSYSYSNFCSYDESFCKSIVSIELSIDWEFSLKILFLNEFFMKSGFEYFNDKFNENSNYGCIQFELSLDRLNTGSFLVVYVWLEIRSGHRIQ